jgi:type I site-specific restriction endonuclease
MKVRLAILAIAVFGAALWMLPARAQENKTQAVVPFNYGTVDPFADLNRAANEAYNSWIAFNESLQDNIADFPACSQEIPAQIQKARDLYIKAAAARGDYLKHWRDLCQQDASRFTQQLLTRPALRREIELTLGSAEKQIADLRLRNEQLENSTKGQGVSAGKAGQSIAALLQNAEERADTLREALEHWDEAQGYVQGSKEQAQAVQNTVKQMQDLFSAESILWQAFYDGLETRAEFECWKVRGGQGPEPRTVYRPVKK